MKNFSNTLVVLVTTIPALEAQGGMIDYTFLLPGIELEKQVLALTTICRNKMTTKSPELNDCCFDMYVLRNLTGS